MSDEHDERKLSLKRLWVLMVTAFVDMIGFALVLPLLPLYAVRFGADAFTVGLLMASFAFGQMAAAPLWGRLSDRVGRRPVILGSLSVAAMAFVTFAFADSVWLLLVCRLLQGSGGANASVLSAYITDSVGPDERAKALGWITACTSAGVMVGPAIGSLVITAGWGWAAPGLIAAGLCVLNILFAWRWLPESTTQRSAKSEAPQNQSIRGEIWGILRRPAEPVSSLILIYASGMLAFFAMNGVMALLLAERFGIHEGNIGLFYVAVGAVSVVMRGLVLGFMVRQFGEVRVLRLGALLLGLGMFAVAASATPTIFLLAVVLVPAGTALLFPSVTSLVSRYTDARKVGQTLGVQQAFGGVSRLLGPVWGGAVYQGIGPSAPFLTGGGLVFLTALFALRLRPGAHRKPSAVEADAEASD